MGGENAGLFFLNCEIEGTTDFHFGSSTTWFENCPIHCKWMKKFTPGPADDISLRSVMGGFYDKINSSPLKQ